MSLVWTLPGNAPIYHIFAVYAVNVWISICPRSIVMKMKWIIYPLDDLPFTDRHVSENTGKLVESWHWALGKMPDWVPSLYHSSNKFIPTTLLGKMPFWDPQKQWEVACGLCMPQETLEAAGAQQLSPLEGPGGSLPWRFGTHGFWIQGSQIYWYRRPICIWFNMKVYEVGRQLCKNCITKNIIRGLRHLHNNIPQNNHDTVEMFKGKNCLWPGTKNSLGSNCWKMLTHNLKKAHGGRARNVQAHEMHFRNTSFLLHAQVLGIYMC